MPPLDISALRNAVSQSRYFLTTHAKERMGQRKISDEQIQRVLTTGDLMEQYPDAQPLPKALFMAFIEKEPLYVSCAFDGEYVHIVTVHWYDPSVWINPWTRRRN